MSLDMYQDNILDHYEHPHNWGHLEKPDARAHDKNPLCGDTFDFEFLFRDGKVEEVRFSGHGCAISTASGSMLTDRLKGMALEEVKKLDQKDILELLGIELSHVRIKCAMLPLKVAKLAIYQHLGEQ